MVQEYGQKIDGANDPAGAAVLVYTTTSSNWNTYERIILSRLALPSERSTTP